MAPQLRLVMIGTLYTTQSWSIGLSFKEIGTANPGQAGLDAWLTASQTPITTWSNAAGGLKALGGAQTRLNSIRAYWADDPSHKPSLVSAIDGLAIVGSTNSIMPAQCSLVCSLHSTNPGRAGRGRVYLPLLAPAMTANGGRTSLNVPDASLALGNLIDSLNGIALAATAVACATRNSQDIITRVIVDNVVDTQRRRRDKIAATQTGITVI